MDLKPLNKAAIPAAVAKAKHYRLLNEPCAAESIIRDVLRIDPDNQEALVLLVLAMADQFGGGYVVADQNINEVLAKLKSDYEREYYTGIACERRGIAQLGSGSPGSGFNAYEWFRDAMHQYDAAQKLSPTDNDDAILRWNTCVRLIERNRLKARDPDVQPEPPQFGE